MINQTSIIIHQSFRIIYWLISGLLVDHQPIILVSLRLCIHLEWRSIQIRISWWSWPSPRQLSFQHSSFVARPVAPRSVFELLQVDLGGRCEALWLLARPQSWAAVGMKNAGFWYHTIFWDHVAVETHWEKVLKALKWLECRITQLFTAVANTFDVSADPTRDRAHGKEGSVAFPKLQGHRGFLLASPSRISPTCVPVSMVH